MYEDVHDPADDARRLRDGDPKAASRMAHRRHDGSRATGPQSSGAAGTRPQRYLDTDWDALVDLIGPLVASSSEPAGWATITVELRRNDGRSTKMHAEVDLGRVDLDHAVSVRLRELFSRVGTPCHGELAVTRRTEDDQRSIWTGDAHVGAREPWVRAEEARLQREQRRLIRELREANRKKDAMMLAMFTQSSDVILAAADLVNAARGMNVAPPEEAPAGSDLASVLTTIFEGAKSVLGRATDQPACSTVADDPYLEVLLESDGESSEDDFDLEAGDWLGLGFEDDPDPAADEFDLGAPFGRAQSSLRQSEDDGPLFDAWAFCGLSIPPENP